MRPNGMPKTLPDDSVSLNTLLTASLEHNCFYFTQNSAEEVSA